MQGSFFLVTCEHGGNRVPLRYREFFQGFTNSARCNLHLELLYGDEPHHVVESLFKALAKAVDIACQRDPRIAGRLPTTKGKL